ncbi:hypothetical protein O4J56_28465 [Nocardiopsis sp. RSe5-2]|uniref:HEAT repeat domain-containing protein n=1 Tax=Nocardiopsis endophytica TaxID=3018445 RepID=A0ABT4UCY3_9ACTN|nr:hypothetical protein [Nocardiopsis endophytica]MDA2814611.1 hypothetical protein [Nocardiopsis endophytica]
MDANTGRKPLTGVHDVEWARLAPERGDEIPGLLQTVASGGAGSMEAVTGLYDILRHPGAGYAAAPEAARFLAGIACHPDTSAPGEALSLLFELVVPVPLAVVPQAWDTDLWRDEVAWAVAADPEQAREQYRQWCSEAPDEQSYRRMSARYGVLGRDGGAALLQAELDVRTAVAERAEALAGLLEGRENRRGMNSTAEWAASILAFVPEAADHAVPRIRARMVEEARRPDDSAAGLRMQDEWRKVLPAEIVALGMLADPADATATVALVGELEAGNLYRSFAAGCALALMHGERAPEQALARLAELGGTRVGFTALFNDAWPHPGVVEPVVLGYVALGRCRGAAAELRTAILPEALAHAGPTAAAVVGEALESVLGPRTGPQDAAEAMEKALTEGGGGEPDRLLRVLWAVAELPRSDWDEHGVGDVVEAWSLPADRAAFRDFVGVDEDEEEDAAEQAAAPAEASPQPKASQERPTGLLGRLFGGN